LGLQEYADVFKCFPQDAMWGNVMGTAALPNAPGAPQACNRASWCVAVFPFVELRPLYDAINKKAGIGIGTTWSGQQTAGSPPPTGISQPPNGQVLSTFGPNTPPNYTGQLVAQVLPNFRCPSDGNITDPDMLGGYSHTNYAGSEGVYWAPGAQPVNQGAGVPWVSTLLPTTRGIFTWSEVCPLAAIRDGTSNTLCIGEVTSSGAGQPVNPNGQFAGNTCGAVETGNYPNCFPMAPNAYVNMSIGPGGMGPSKYGAANPGPLPPLFFKGNPAMYAIPQDIANGWALAGGTGKSRAILLLPGGTGPVAYVFRSLFAAMSTTVTGGAPLAGPGQAIFPMGSSDWANSGGWEYSYTSTLRVFGYQPTFNGLYGPESNWPGPDSNHPGTVVVGFCDGSARALQQNVDHTVWCSLNTRAGGEPLTTADF